ncbi:hypothetical protein CYY_003766 [Polysphondylium violaceum]|uniref:G-protein coupled receptors family 2 profile 2 domain-containing protein n=1 Tax=Polysphondylium violaceum TaxID=133409 RepID=A0A8J4PVS3_9MYCE|nr:hypothetical protein CYY_003766 [Polysphondylium violaceum]
MLVHHTHSKKNYSIYYFTLLFIFCNIVNSQNAIDFTARCEPYIGNTPCDPYIFNKNSIYVTDSMNQVSINTTISQYLGIMGLVQGCAVPDTFKVVCNQYFQPCINVTLDGSFAGAQQKYLNIRPCRDQCVAGNQRCGLSLSCVNSFKDDPNIFEFPVSENTYNLSPYGGPNPFNLVCLDTHTMVAGNYPSTYNESDAGSTAPIPDTCTNPLIYRNTTEREEDIKKGYYYLGASNCLLPCPVPFFTHREWHQFELLVSITGCFSFVCTFFNVFTYGILNRNFDRHAIGILFLSFSLFMCMMADVIIASQGFELACPEPGRYARQADGYCTANGVIFQYGAVSTVMWWSTMAIDLWMVIKKVTPGKTYVKYYIIGINCLAIIFTILPLFWKGYGYGFGGVGCWLISNGWQNGVFWIPQTVCLFIGTTFIILILIEVYKIVRAVGKGTSRVMELNLRPFLIILFIFGEYLYLVIYHFWVQHNTDKFTQNVVDYVVCLQQYGENAGCETRTVPYNAQFVFLFFLRLLGIEVLIFYGINTRTKKIWKESWLLNNKYFFYLQTKMETITTWNSSKRSKEFPTAPSHAQSSQFSVGLSSADDNDHL